MTRNIHFVGSLGMDNAETAFRTLAATVGSMAKRYTDGEAGVRKDWFGWQARFFDEHPSFERNKVSTGIDPEKYKLRDGSDPKTLEFSNIGYAEEALNSYRLFLKLRESGVIPPGVRFQVSLPTPLAVVGGFVIPDQCESVEPAYDRAMAKELETMAANIPHRDLAVQWDVCIEVLAYDGGIPTYVADILKHATTNVSRLTGLIPEEVDAGIHLCYGDPDHKHIVEPADLTTSVKFANAIVAASPRRLDWVHMAVPRDRNDREYFSPLADLDTGSAELVLGLVHYSDGLEGTQERMATADQVVSDYGIAAECGFGRRSPDTVSRLLQIHAEAADMWRET